MGRPPLSKGMVCEDRPLELALEQRRITGPVILISDFEEFSKPSFQAGQPSSSELGNAMSRQTGAADDASPPMRLSLELGRCDCPDQ